MFKKPTKKQFIIRRVALAILATTSVVIIVTASIFLMLGYRLDSDSGRLSQGALLQFDSLPNTATVSIDGGAVSGRTPSKQTVIAGDHTIEMAKNGYETWGRSLTLEAGTLTWLDYTRLVPSERKVQQVSSYRTLTGMKISEDGKWALAHQDAASPQFELIDLRAANVRTSTVSLPASAYSESETDGVAHSFSVVSWNENGRYAILAHTYNDKTEWIVLDTQDAARSVNATQLLSVDFIDVKFAATNGSVLFGLSTDRVVRKLDLSAGTISRGLVTNVDSFSIYDETVITYIGTDPEDATQRVAGMYRDGEERPHVLYRSEVPDEPLSIKTTRYFSDDYVAIASGDNVTVLSGSYPLANSEDNASLKEFATFTTASNVTDLSFSPGGDYVLAQAGANFASYELEHKRLATSSQAVEPTQTPTPLRWLGIAQLWTNTGGTLTMRDFDGVYTHSIMPVLPGFDANISQNGRFFYGVGQSDEGFHLQRVQMILE